MSTMTIQQLMWLSLVFSVGSAVLSAWFADRKGRDVWGWALLGLALGAVALVVVIVLPNRRKATPPPQRR